MDRKQLPLNSLQLFLIFIWQILGVALFLSFVPLESLGSELKKGNNREIYEVLSRVSKESGVEFKTLARIAYIESRFKPNAVRINLNGTQDDGLMQINSRTRKERCANVNISTLLGNVRCAAHLILIAKRHKATDPHWLGRYHSKTPSKKRRYYALIQGEY